jgi:hypothetical protein
VFSLIERKGRVRSHHVTEVSAKTLRPILQAHVDAATFIMTDEGGAAKKIGSEFERYGSVNHGIGEYVRGDIHINIAEKYFSVFKRHLRDISSHQPTTFKALSGRV